MTDRHPSPASILPHSYPFVLIDRIIEREEGKRIVCLKNVTFNEEFFQGHFRDMPVMPGVLIIEAMAQASGLLLRGDRTGIRTFLARVKDVRFREVVMPGDSLYITSAKSNEFGSFHVFNVSVAVNEKTVAEGEILLAEIKEEEDVKHAD